MLWIVVALAVVVLLALDWFFAGWVAHRRAPAPQPLTAAQQEAHGMLAMHQGMNAGI